MGNTFITNARPRIRIFGTGYRFFDLDYSYVLLSKPELDESIWDGCDLKYSHINLGNIRNALFRQCDMAFASIGRTAVISTEFSDVRFTAASIHASSFINCVFSRVTFDHCYLYEVSFINCWFKDCSFDDVNGDPGVFDVNCEFTGGSPDTGKPYIPMACPDKGEFIGYKKAEAYVPGYLGDTGNVIVTLRIPASARRSSALGRKCRCEYAEVIDIEWADEYLKKTAEPPKRAQSSYCPVVYSARGQKEKWVGLEYVLGSMVYPDSFDPDRWHECTNGIHFFINKQEAINY